MKKILCILFAAICAALPAGCAAEVPPAEPLGVAEIVAPAEGTELYRSASVTINGEELPLYNVKVSNLHYGTQNYDARDDFGIGYVNTDGRISIEVKFGYELYGTTVVRPVTENVSYRIGADGRSIAFSVSEAGYYVVEPNGNYDKAVLLVVSPPTESIDSSAYENVIHFEKGIYNKQNCEYFQDNDLILIRSNTLVYLDEGAILQGGFESYGAENIAIAGKGIIDTSGFERRVSPVVALVPVSILYAKNVKISDISIFDPAGLSCVLYFCDGAEINGIKIISSRANGDGISVQSCKNVTVDGCFVRGYDDNLVVKNMPLYLDYFQTEGETQNVKFTNCTLWCDLAQCMEIGYETIGSRISDVTFENITVLHAFHRPVMSVHNSNNSVVENVVFKNITVEDASMGDKELIPPYFIEINAKHSVEWSDNYKVTGLGEVNGVYFENINVISGGRKELQIMLEGSTDERDGTRHYVRNVYFKNMSFYGETVTEDYPFLSKNEFTENIFIGLS